MKQLIVFNFFCLAVLLVPALANAQLAKTNQCLGVSAIDAQPCGPTRTGWYVDKTTGDMHYLYKGTDWLEITGSSTTVTLQSNQATTVSIAEALTVSGAITFSSTSGLDVSGGDITLENDEVIKNDNNGEIELGNGTEDTAFSWGSNTVVLSSDTGVVLVDFGAVGTTLQLANDQTIISDTNNEIQFGDGTEDLSLGFATANEVTVTSDTGVTRVDFESIGVQTTRPIMMLEKMTFCGNGPNAGTSFMGPVNLEDLEGAGDAPAEDDLAFGGTACDALDSSTEGNVDDVPLAFQIPIAVYPVAMVCVGVCTGATAADDQVTFTLREATADADADMTCNFTFAGDATANSCTAYDPTPTAIAASAVAAMEMVNTDDACADGGDDFLCHVYYTY